MNRFLTHTIGLLMLLNLLTKNPIFLSPREQLIVKVLYSPVRAILKQRFSLTIWLVDCCDFPVFEIMKQVFWQVLQSF